MVRLGEYTKSSWWLLIYPKNTNVPVPQTSDTPTVGTKPRVLLITASVLRSVYDDSQRSCQ